MFIKMLKVVRHLAHTKYAVVIAEVVLMTLLTLGSFSILVRLTDVKTIGLWVLLNSLLSFSRMADFWSVGLVTFVAEEVGRGEHKSAARLVSTAMVTGAAGFFLIISIAGPILYLIAGSIPGITDADQVRRMLPLMCVTFWLTSVAITYHVGFLGFNRPAYKLIQNVGGSLVFFVLSISLAPHYGVWGILIAQAIQAAMMLTFGILVFKRSVANSGSAFAWNSEDFSRLARYGSKATLVGVLQIASDPLIRLLMSKFGGLGAVTMMELATRMILAVRGLVLSAGQLMVPAFAKASIENTQATEKLYADANRIFMLVTIPVLSCLLAMGPAMEIVMLGKPDPLFLPMLWLLSIGWGVNIITAPAFFLLTGRRRLKPLFWNRLFMLLAVGVLGFVGGHIMGVLGVTLGVALGLIIASWVIFKAAKEFEPKHKQTAKNDIGLWVVLPIAMATLVTAAGLHLQFNGYATIYILANSVLGCCLTLLCAFFVLPLQDLGFKTARELRV
jgi:O-antigen/teichoic acid export membrane protein